MTSSWVLTLLCLVTFALSGFYTYGRAYRGRYKALIIAQAVSLGYLLFGCLAYVLGGMFFLRVAVIVLAWLLSMAFLIAARLWALLWTNVVLAERRLFARRAERPIKQCSSLVAGLYWLGFAAEVERWLSCALA